MIKLFVFVVLLGTVYLLYMDLKQTRELQAKQAKVYRGHGDLCPKKVLCTPCAHTSKRREMLQDTEHVKTMIETWVHSDQGHWRETLVNKLVQFRTDQLDYVLETPRELKGPKGHLKTPVGGLECKHRDDPKYKNSPDFQTKHPHECPENYFCDLQHKDGFKTAKNICQPCSICCEQATASNSCYTECGCSKKDGGCSTHLDCMTDHEKDKVFESSESSKVTDLFRDDESFRIQESCQDGKCQSCHECCKSDKWDQCGIEGSDDRRRDYCKCKPDTVCTEHAACGEGEFCVRGGNQCGKCEDCCAGRVKGKGNTCGGCQCPDHNFVRKALLEELVDISIKDTTGNFLISRPVAPWELPKPSKRVEFVDQHAEFFLLLILRPYLLATEAFTRQQVKFQGRTTGTRVPEDEIAYRERVRKVLEAHQGAKCTLMAKLLSWLLQDEPFVWAVKLFKHFVHHPFALSEEEGDQLVTALAESLHTRFLPVHQCIDFAAAMQNLYQLGVDLVHRKADDKVVQASVRKLAPDINWDAVLVLLPDTAEVLADVVPEVSFFDPVSSTARSLLRGLAEHVRDLDAKDGVVKGCF